MAMDDYLELPLYIDDLPEGRIIDLWVMKDHQKVIGVFKNVTSCLRYKGWWSIDHKHSWMSMTALVPADEVVYFNIVERDDPDYESNNNFNQGEE